MQRQRALLGMQAARMQAAAMEAARSSESRQVVANRGARIGTLLRLRRSDGNMMP